MTPDPDRKPTRQEMRQGGMVAAVMEGCMTSNSEG